jgi:hypothetical protein
MFSLMTSTPQSSVSAPSLADLEKFKREMTAVPSGQLAITQLHRDIGGSYSDYRNGKKKRSAVRNLSGSSSSSSCPSINKAFNTVATRPGYGLKARIPQLSTIMSYTSTALYSTSTITTVVAGTAFVLTNFAEYANYIALFDQYRFDELEIWLEPQSSQSTVFSNMGQMATTIDLDDANTPSSYNSVVGRQQVVITDGGVGHYHRWKPHMAVAVYSGAFTSFQNAPADWIDCASSSVQHYGLKFSSLPTSAVINYNLTVRGKLSFRSAGI